MVHSLFQSCTEMVMPMCNNGTDMFDPVAWNFTQFAANCQKVKKFVFAAFKKNCLLDTWRSTPTGLDPHGLRDI